MKKFAVLALALMPFFFTSCEKYKNAFSGKWGSTESYRLSDGQKVYAILEFEDVLNGREGEVLFELRKSVGSEVLKTIWTGSYYNDGSKATEITMTKKLKDELKLDLTEFPEKWTGTCTKKSMRVWLKSSDLMSANGGINWEFWSEYDFDE